MTTTRTRKRCDAVSVEDDRIARFLHESMLPEHAAEARHFVRFCRNSLFIRAWLFERFATKPATQAAFRKLLADPASIAANAPLWSPLMTRMVLSEAPRQIGRAGPHGGLSEARILALIKRYQGGGMDTMTFLLVRLGRAWQRRAAPISGRLPGGDHRALDGGRKRPVGASGARLPARRPLLPGALRSGYR